MKLAPALMIIATLAGCGDEDACEVGVHRCSSDMLQECSADGVWDDSHDCAADGMFCHSEGDAHCMLEGDDMGEDDSGETGAER